MRRLVRSAVRDVHRDFETEAQIGEGGCRPLHESSPVVDKLNSTVFDGWKEHSSNINAIFAPFQLAGLKSADRARVIPTSPLAVNRLGAMKLFSPLFLPRFPAGALFTIDTVFRVNANAQASNQAGTWDLIKINKQSMRGHVLCNLMDWSSKLLPLHFSIDTTRRHSCA